MSSVGNVGAAATAPRGAEGAGSVPDPARRPESYGRLFGRFLRFGLLAWGGPVAQIAMLRRELVDEERWITPEHFDRVFGVYQVLPGPEAHELCVYFGMRERGRLGGLLAGLGFMLPGFLLMLLLPWLYVARGGTTAAFAAAFYGMQPAVAALVVRAVHRIAQPILRDGWLWAIAGVSAPATAAGVHFALVLRASGLAYAAARRGRRVLAAACGATLAVAAAYLLARYGVSAADPVTAGAAESVAGSPARAQSLPALFWSGLRSGLLTFGGAYTVIPFLRRDAVVRGGWMTDAQFLDGLALSGVLPAPLIIFATFAGYLGGGLPGALALTAGIFLPAFGFTLAAHEQLERITTRPAVQTFLAGVTAGEVGLIAVTAVVLARHAVVDVPALAIAAVALLVLYRWHAKLAVLVVVLGAALAGWAVVASRAS